MTITHECGYCGATIIAGTNVGHKTFCPHRESQAPAEDLRVEAEKIQVGGGKTAIDAVMQWRQRHAALLLVLDKIRKAARRAGNDEILQLTIEAIKADKEPHG